MYRISSFCTGLSFLCAVAPSPTLDISHAFLIRKTQQGIVIQMAVVSSLFQAHSRRAAVKWLGGAHGDERGSVPVHDVVLSGRARHGHGHRLAAQLPGLCWRLPGGASGGAASQRLRSPGVTEQHPAHQGPHRGRALCRCGSTTTLENIENLCTFVCSWCLRTTTL